MFARLWAQPQQSLHVCLLRALCETQPGLQSRQGWMLYCLIHSEGLLRVQPAKVFPRISKSGRVVIQCERWRNQRLYCCRPINVKQIGPLSIKGSSISSECFSNIQELLHLPFFKWKKKVSSFPKQRIATKFCPVMPFVPQQMNTSFKTHYLPNLIIFCEG